MIKSAIKYSILAIAISLASISNAQSSGQYNEPFSYHRSSFFIMVGYLDGPSFQDFVDWANEYYHSLGATENLSDFKAGLCLSVGLRTRFSQYFAFEVDFLTATKRTQTDFTTNRGIVPQDLDLTIGAVTFSVPIIFDFSNKQPVVPFVAAGATVFPLRLDHRIDFPYRHTKTALAGNFSFGLDSKIGSRLSITARTDFTFGKASMPVTQYENQPDHFDIDLSTTQIQAGIMYAFQ